MIRGLIVINSVPSFDEYYTNEGTREQMTSQMFIGTYNNIDTTIAEAYLEKWHTQHKAVYVTGQIERGKEGTIHLQFFVQFAKEHKKRVSAMKKLCPHAHWERVGINNGADEYCNKEDTRVEGPWTFGVKPARLNVKGDKARRNKELIEMGAEKAVEAGIIDITDYAKVKSNIDLYKNCTAEHKSLDTLDNYWIWGKPGIGKTSHVIKETNDKYYEKDKSKYWNGYVDQDDVLVDDLE